MTAEQLDAVERNTETRDMVRDIAPHEPEDAEIFTRILDRLDALERENRRLNRIVAAMEERIETRGAMSEAYREYAQSGAYDPRD